MPGMSELMIILFIVLLLFGGKKIPELFSGLGKGIKSFRKSLDEDENEKDDQLTENKTSDSEN